MKIDGMNLPGTGQEFLNPGRAAQKDPEDFQQKLERAQGTTEIKQGDQNATNVEKEKSAEDKELMEAARQFESLFIQQMMEGMRETIPESDLLDGGFAEETYEGMLDQAYSEKMAESGGLGLADKIYDQLTSERAGVSPEHQVNVSTDGENK